MKIFKVKASSGAQMEIKADRFEVYGSGMAVFLTGNQNSHYITGVTEIILAGEEVVPTKEPSALAVVNTCGEEAAAPPSDPSVGSPS